MPASQTESWLTNKRLFLLLAAVVVFTAVILLIMMLTPKATVAEIRTVVDRAVFDVEAPRGPDSYTSLLSNDVKAVALESRGFQAVTAAKTGGKPLDEHFENGTENKVQIRGDRPFTPDLRVNSKISIALQPAGRNRLLIELGGDDAGFGWQLRSITTRPLQMRTAEDWETIAGNPPALISGDGSGASIGLQLEDHTRPSATQLHVVDLNSGEIASSHDLPVDLPTSEIALVEGDRLILLSGSAAAGSPLMLLAPNLRISSPRFYRLTGTQIQSHVREGGIRFPAGETEPVDIEPDSLLEIQSKSPMTLKSAKLVGSGMELVYWGTPSSVRIGPTPHLMSETLPNYFIWIYNHRLGTLAFSVLVWMVGMTLGAVKLFGWVK